MSVIGIDLGNDTCKIGMAARGGIDIILNESSNRKNPTLVSFQGKQRLMGESAASIARSNFKNTVREVKRLVGRRWGARELEEDLKRFPFKTRKHEETGGVGIEVDYDDGVKVFTPEQIVACMLTKLVAIAKAANNGIDVADTVIAIPGWYTDSMRSAMLSSCAVAGINCLRLIHEHTATALAYGIYRSAKGEFHEKDPEYVLFLDLGHSSFSASVVTFIQGTLSVKSAAFDSQLGGRDMDWAIAQHLADEFKAKTEKDARTKPKAMLKLMEAAERAKKQLSPVGVTDAPINIECLWEDLDYTGRLSLDKFQELIKPLVDRMNAPVMKALADAGVTKEQLGSVEIVGGATRVPLVKSHLADLLGRDKSAINFGLSCTMNADESIARGCALQCAMLSKRFKVKEFNVMEIVPYPISVSWEGNSSPNGENLATEDGEEDTAEASGCTSLKIFNKAEETPKVRRVNFVMSKPFTLTASYDSEAVLPEGTLPCIGTFTVDVPEGSAASKIRVNVKHDIHGMFSVQSAELMKEVVKEAAPAGEKDGAADEKAKCDPGASPMDVDTEGGKGTAAGEQAAPNANGSAHPEGEQAAANGVPSGAEGKGSEDKAASKGGEAAPKKKVYNKVPLKVDPKTSAWNKAQIDAAVLEEAQMANQDRVLRETADKRNELESYIYAMRDKIVGSLKPYVEGEEADNFGSKLTAAEDWLYSDEGFDSTKSVYTAKLKELTDLGEPVESRLYEANHRQETAAELQRVIDGYIKFANSSDELYAHIETRDKATVRDAAKTAEKWLFQKLDQQANVPPSKNPVVSCEHIRKQAAALHSTCKPIMNKPKPAPKPEPVKGGDAGAKGGAADGAAGAKEGQSASTEGAGDAGGPKTSAEGTTGSGKTPAGTAGSDGKNAEETAPSNTSDRATTPMDTDEVEQME